MALESAVGVVRYIELNADLFEFDDRFPDAIDRFEAIPDRREFEDRYTVKLGYLELMMKNYRKAAERFQSFLEQRNFGLRFQVEIINYEFAKSKGGKKGISKKRLAKL